MTNPDTQQQTTLALIAANANAAANAFNNATNAYNNAANANIQAANAAALNNPAAFPAACAAVEACNTAVVASIKALQPAIDAYLFATLSGGANGAYRSGLAGPTCCACKCIAASQSSQSSTLAAKTLELADLQKALDSKMALDILQAKSLNIQTIVTATSGQ